jgi:hypothetical protein
MKKVKVINITGLSIFLTDNSIDYEIIQDGWFVEIQYNDDADLFRIGLMFGKKLMYEQLSKA